VRVDIKKVIEAAKKGDIEKIERLIGKPEGLGEMKVPQQLIDHLFRNNYLNPKYNLATAVQYAVIHGYKPENHIMFH
jgi:hypothetical protein